MSASDRSDRPSPEVRAFRELETLVRHLGEELATFRRRALQAENQLKDSGHGHAAKSGRGAPHSERYSELETENDTLRTRLERAEERVRQMMDRVRFLRQQLQSAGGAPAGRP